jgi:hypothetical protein
MLKFNKIFVLINLLSLFLLLCCVDSTSPKAENPKNVIQPLTICEALEKGSLRGEIPFVDTCYIMDIGDLSSCNNSEDMDGCYLELAIKLKDTALCEKFWPKRSCGQGDLACFKDKGFRERCYYSISLDTNNKELCDSLDDYEKTVCLAQFSQNDSICESIDFGSRGMCYLRFAVAKKDYAACYMIDDSIERIPYYYFSNFKAYQSMRSIDCFKGVLSARENGSDCEMIGNSSISRESCYESHGEDLMRKALTMNNPAYCEKINIPHANIPHLTELDNVCTGYYESYYSFPECGFYKDICYLNLALYNQDTSFCSKTSSREKNICFAIIAIAKADLSICDMIDYTDESGAEDKARCIIGIAVRINDQSICEKIDKELDWYLYACYSSVGAVLEDKSVCSKIDKRMKDFEKGTGVNDAYNYKSYTEVRDNCLGQKVKTN